MSDAPTPELDPPVLQVRCRGFRVIPYRELMLAAIMPMLGIVIVPTTTARLVAMYASSVREMTRWGCTGGRMRLVFVAAILTAVSLLAGCSKSDNPQSLEAVETSTPSSSAISEPETSTQPEVSTSVSATPRTSTGVPVIRTGKQSLTLADAQATDSWEESSFDVPKVSDPVQAIATDVGCFSSGRVLEFRFSLESGVLNVGVAQSQDSKSSSEVLQFSLLADGRSVDVKKIAFDQQAMLTTQLDGVSVVKVYVEHAEGPGSCQETTALLTSVDIE